MAKTTPFEYPSISIDEAIKCARILVEKLGGHTNNQEAYASLIGHKTAKSGAFIVKIGDLRKYGVIEPRGDIKATQLAKQLVHPINGEEKQSAINQMIMRVDLWRKIHEKIGTAMPPDSEFWVYLMNATGKDRADAIKYADEIRSKYREVISHYRESLAVSAGMQTQSNNQKPAEQSEQTSTNIPSASSENYTEIQFEDIYIRFPKGDIEAAETAKELIEMQLRKLNKN